MSLVWESTLLLALT